MSPLKDTYLKGAARCWCIMVDLEKNERYFSRVAATSEKVREEMEAGLSLLKGIEEPIVTFFGSHTIADDDTVAVQARGLAKRLGQQGFAICSGGGPGIMKAANAGAMEASAPSIGFKEALLQGEQGVDKRFFTHQFAFEFMFVRRFALAIKSDALVFYPGGFGTLNELFEYVVLMQTAIVDRVPVVCVGKEFWEGLFSWAAERMVPAGLVKEEHMDLIRIVDSLDEAVAAIKGR